MGRKPNRCRTCGGFHSSQQLSAVQAKAVLSRQMDTECQHCGAMASYMTYCYWCKSRDHLRHVMHSEQTRPLMCDKDDVAPDPAKRVH